MVPFSQIRSRIPPCVPPLWARTGHLQTILGHLLPSQTHLPLGKTYLIELEHPEEKLSATFYRGKENVLVYLFHGLAGDIEADYMRRTATVALDLGFSVLLTNHRGCGTGAGLAQESYHSGRAEDLASVIAFGRKLCPDAKHVAVGFSLSANALLLLAANVRGHTLPDIAIAVNGPINLARAAHFLSQGLNRIYDLRFVIELKKYLKMNRPRETLKLESVWNLREFDDKYTAPFGGFQNAKDYYARCSAKQYLKEIQIPTLLLTAADDPFVCIEDYDDAELSDQVFLHRELHGGHMGYLSRSEKGYVRWLDLALKTYLENLGR